VTIPNIHQRAEMRPQKWGHIPNLKEGFDEEFSNFTRLAKAVNIKPE
jgi:hypothetical protein